MLFSFKFQQTSSRDAPFGALRHFFTLLSCAARISSFDGMFPLPATQVVLLRVHSSFLYVDHHFLLHKSSCRVFTIPSRVLINISFVRKHHLDPLPRVHSFSRVVGKSSFEHHLDPPGVTSYICQHPSGILR